MEVKFTEGYWNGHSCPEKRLRGRFVQIGVKKLHGDVKAVFPIPTRRSLRRESSLY